MEGLSADDKGNTVCRNGRRKTGPGGARIPASILIADDDPNILRALAFIMQRAGYRVRTARNGAETLEQALTAPPDLLLLDLMMPRGNGYEVCSKLRASPRCDGTRIVMLTARGQDAEQRNGLALGADAYVKKPFGVAEVAACVADLLARPRRAGD